MTTKEASIGIIDDDPVYQFTAKKIVELSHRAGKIHQFTSGDEALTYLSDHRELVDVSSPQTVVDHPNREDLHRAARCACREGVLVE